MSNPFDELGGKAETYQQALARCICLSPQGMTEQERAERLVRDRERMRQHDAHFADDFLSLDEERIISRALCRQLGHPIHDSIPE